MAHEDPRTIFQDLLDRVSEAGAGGRVETMLPFFSLPYLHEALDAKIMLETQDDLRVGLSAFYETLRAKGVTQMIRLCSQADYLSPNYIDGQYVTHLLHNSRPIVRSYTNRAVIRRTDDGWKLAQTINGFSHKIWPIRVFYVPEDPPEYGLAQHDDARRDALEPLAIYQSFINRMTQANVAGDKDAYLSLCALPVWWHLDENDHEFADASAISEFVDSVSELLAEHEIEDFLRIADHAEFVSGSEICGYHTTHFLRGGEPALDPVKSRLLLRRKGTRWYMHSVTNALKYSDHPMRNPIMTTDLATQLDIQKRTKTWPTLQ